MAKKVLGQLTGMMDRNAALFTGKYTDYRTPKPLFDELNKEFHFTLDPCAAYDSNFDLPKTYTKEQDGLKKKWAEEKVFVNPPYGKEVAIWIKKGFDSVYVDANRAKLVVFLLPVRTDTDWFHRYIYNTKGAEIRFLRGRLLFEMPHNTHKNTAPFPSMVVIFRRNEF